MSSLLATRRGAATSEVSAVRAAAISQELSGGACGVVSIHEAVSIFCLRGLNDRFPGAQGRQQGSEVSAAGLQQGLVVTNCSTTLSLTHPKVDESTQGSQSRDEVSRDRCTRLLVNVTQL